MYSLCKSLIFALILSACATPLNGQNVYAAISGTVLDPNGAAIANAEVTATTMENGLIRTGQTDGKGFFSFPNLTPGTFSLAVTAPGFKRYNQERIEINAGDERALGEITLRLGMSSETVTIEANSVTVNLGSGENAAVITGQQLNDLALKGRDVFDAIGLLAGVTDTSTSRDAPGPTSNNNIYIMGARSNSNNMSVDGVTNLDTGSNGSLHSMPSMDTVAEVKVLKSNFAAEYGRNSGGSIMVITKGGELLYHGTAGWYYKHEDFAANDFFNNRNGVSRPPYRYNIASYTFSGPVIVPKLLHRDRSKLFFLISQEFQYQHVGYGTKAVTVPTAMERQGDFSRSYDVNGKLIPVKDTLNAGKQFPGNIVPPSRLNPIGIKILNLFPLPNFIEPIPSRLYQDNYISAGSGLYPRRTDTIRLDYSPHPNWQMYIRASNNSDSQTAPYGLWVNGGVNFPLDSIVFKQPGRGAVFHSTNTITPSFFSEFVFGVSQNKLFYYPANAAAATRTGTGILLAQRNPSINPGNLIPDMTFGSIANYANPSFSDGTPYANSNTIFSAAESLSKISGTHSIKGGVYFERARKDQLANAFTRGSIKFDKDTSNPLDSGDAYANALLGVFDSYSESSSRPQGQFRFSNLEFYAQDTWKATARLTLDFGMRLYHDMPQYDARNQLSSFVPSLYDPSQAPVLLYPGYDANKNKVAVDPRTGKTYAAGLIGSYAPGEGNILDGIALAGKNGFPSSLYTTTGLAWGPRFGFAYDPIGDGRTAIRGGAGVFFDRIQGNPTMNLLNNPPAIYSPVAEYGTFGGLLQSISSGLLAPSGSENALSGNQKIPTAYNYSFEIQRQISRSSIIRIGYGGTAARHLLFERNLNPVPIGAQFLTQNPASRDPTATGNALPNNFLRPFQGLGDINAFEFGGTSSYNSLQAQFSQRWSHGFNVQASYTFSKVLDLVDSDTAAVDPFLNYRHRNYGPAGYDRTHVFSVSYNYKVPNVSRAVHFRPIHWAADNWQLSGIGRIQSGGPFTPGYSLVAGTNITGSPSENSFTHLDLVNPGAPLLQRFAPPKVGTFGNLGPNTLREPGMDNWDTSIYRDIPINERFRSQLRVESYNTLNHTQFLTVQPTARFDATGAQIDPTFLTANAARAPRRIQFAVKLMF